MRLSRKRGRSCWEDAEVALNLECIPPLKIALSMESGTPSAVELHRLVESAPGSTVETAFWSIEFKGAFLT